MIKNLKLFTVLFLALAIQSCSNNDFMSHNLRQFMNTLQQAVIIPI